MTANSISAKQLRIAQLLWSQNEHRSLDVTGDSRKARLDFAADVIGHSVASFSEMTRYEAHRVINALKKAMGLPITMRSQRDAQDRGLQGRKRSPRHDVIASNEDGQRIEAALVRLGWNKERFTAWLESPRSPLKGKAEVRTQADANRVWWALKKMLRRADLWSKDAA